MNLNHGQEVIEDEDEGEVDGDEGEQKQSANHSSRILVEVPVEVREVPVTIYKLSFLSVIFNASSSLHWRMVQKKKNDNETFVNHHWPRRKKFSTLSKSC